MQAASSAAPEDGSEFDRIRRTVGKEGKIAQRASIGYSSGDWRNWVESVNSLIEPSTMSRA